MLPGASRKRPREPAPGADEDSDRTRLGEEAAARTWGGDHAKDLVAKACIRISAGLRTEGKPALAASLGEASVPALHELLRAHWASDAPPPPSVRTPSGRSGLVPGTPSESLAGAHPITCFFEPRPRPGQRSRPSLRWWGVSEEGRRAEPAPRAETATRLNGAGRRAGGGRRAEGRGAPARREGPARRESIGTRHEAGGWRRGDGGRRPDMGRPRDPRTVDRAPPPGRTRHGDGR